MLDKISKDELEIVLSEGIQHKHYEDEKVLVVRLNKNHQFHYNFTPLPYKEDITCFIIALRFKGYEDFNENGNYIGEEIDEFYLLHFIEKFRDDIINIIKNINSFPQPFYLMPYSFSA